MLMFSELPPDHLLACTIEDCKYQREYGHRCDYCVNGGCKEYWHEADIKIRDAQLKAFYSPDYHEQILTSRNALARLSRNDCWMHEAEKEWQRKKPRLAAK